jgi:hypothetical protein
MVATRRVEENRKMVARWSREAMCRLSWPAVAARGRRGAGCFFYTDRR